MASFMEAPEVQEIAERLIAAHHQHLQQASIRYLFRVGEWTAHHQVVYGAARAVTGLMGYLTGLDFVILINRGIWPGLTDGQKEALVDHELCHCRRKVTEDGVVTWYTVGHPVEDFFEVIERHGYWNRDLKRLGEVAERLQQRPLFGPEFCQQLEKQLEGKFPHLGPFEVIPGGAQEVG